MQYAQSPTQRSWHTSYVYSSRGNPVLQPYFLVALSSHPCDCDLALHLFHTVVADEIEHVTPYKSWSRAAKCSVDIGFKHATKAQPQSLLFYLL